MEHKRPISGLCPHNQCMVIPTAIRELITELAGERDFEKSLNSIARTAVMVTRSRYAMLGLLDEESGRLDLRTMSVDDQGNPTPMELSAPALPHTDGIVGYVAATGSPVVSGNVTEDPRYRRLYPTTQSEIAVPIRDRHDRVRAVLNLEADRRDAYDDELRSTVESLASLGTMVIEQHDHRVREEALIQIGGSLEEALTEEGLIHKVIGVAEDVLRLQACSIFILDPKSDMFVLRGTIGRLKNQIGELAYGRKEGFTGWVGDTGEAILLDNPQGDPRWRGKYVEIPSDEIASFVAVPIIVRGKSIGAIRVLRRKSENSLLDNRFTTDDLRLLDAIAEQVAIGLENTRNMEKIIRSERMIAWGELSAKSSHMIGNRVFALKGDINELRHLLEESKPDFKEMSSLQKSLATNVTRVEEILQDFRDFVTATQLHRTPTDLNALVRETLDEVFPRRSEVELHVNLDREVPMMNLDGKKFRRALSELIENSLNHMDRGQLQVTTAMGHRTDEGRVRKPRTYVEISVEDTGPGVDPDQKSLIFQPFFSQRVKGMGLGLSIVKGIVDAHGGEVTEAGDPGEGAKFVIRLPI